MKQMRDVGRSFGPRKKRLRGKERRVLHPTQKPEEMLKRIIITSSNKNDTVLDQFLGSGTMAFVTQKLSRNWIGIKKRKKYVDMAKKRIMGNV